MHPRGDIFLPRVRAPSALNMAEFPGDIDTVMINGSILITLMYIYGLIKGSVQVEQI